MKLIIDTEKCFECGDIKQEDHHIIPRSRGGQKTIPLCTPCHYRVHNKIGKGMVDGYDHSNLIKKGITKSREEKGHWGRPITRDSQLIRDLHEAGFSYREISLAANCAVSTVHREIKEWKNETNIS